MHRYIKIYKICYYCYYYICRNYHPKHLQTLNLNFSKALYILSISPYLSISRYISISRCPFYPTGGSLSPPDPPLRSLRPTPTHMRWAFFLCTHIHILIYSHTHALTHTHQATTNAATLCVADTRRLLQY